MGSVRSDLAGLDEVVEGVAGDVQDLGILARREPGLDECVDREAAFLAELEDRQFLIGGIKKNPDSLTRCPGLLGKRFFSVRGVIARFVPEITLRKKNGRTWGSVQCSSDPVSRCPANPEPFGSLAGRQSGFNEFLGGRNGVRVKRGATGSFTASFGGGNAVAGALGNQTALEMRNGAEDVENQFARGRCGVDSFFEADQVNAADLEAFDGIEQFFEGAAEAIETGNREADAGPGMVDQFRQNAGTVG